MYACLHVSCGFICEKMFSGDFSAVFNTELPADFLYESFQQICFHFLAGNSAGKFPADL
jgi:hypothetical protein